MLGSRSSQGPGSVADDVVMSLMDGLLDRGRTCIPTTGIPVSAWPRSCSGERPIDWDDQEEPAGTAQRP